MATCAEVAVDRPAVVSRCVRVVTAFECGAIVNPEHLKNQIEGAVMMGLGGALFEAIRFANGQDPQPAFLRLSRAALRATCRSSRPCCWIARICRRPARARRRSIALAPAVGNAIFQAAGVRLRSLPMAPKGVKKS